MPPPRAPNPVSFSPTSLATPQPLKRPREYAADDVDESKIPSTLPLAKKQSRFLKKAEQAAPKGKRPVIGGDGDGGRAVLSTPSSRERQPRPLDPEDEEKFKELSVYCSSPLRQFIRETYGPPTLADPASDRAGAGDNQGQANESYEGGNEGTMTGGSTPS